MGIYGGIQLPNINEENLDDKKERKQILNYLALLDEKLRYMFQNIDIEENLSEESKGMFLEMGKEIKNLVQDTDGRFSMLTQTVDGINTLVSDPDKGLSAISQKADSIESLVGNMKGDMSSISQRADRIDLIVTSGSTSGKITLTTGMKDAIESQVSIEAEEIDLTGYVTFNDLEKEGKTEINGANITTGKVSADYIGLYGWMRVRKEFDGSDYTGTGGYIGYSTGDDGVNATTEGIAVSSNDGDHYLLATNSGIRMTAEANAIVVMDNQISATEEISISSDRRVKDGIGYDMEKYEEFFSRLKPSHYKYTFGNSGRDHIGFIAQDVEEAINESGITTQNFAGLVQLSEESKLIGNYADQYYLRYDNFIALNTHMIQKLMARVSELESKLEALS